MIAHKRDTALRLTRITLIPGAGPGIFFCPIWKGKPPCHTIPNNFSIYLTIYLLP
jgi:hypothetical protein